MEKEKVITIPEFFKRKQLYTGNTDSHRGLFRHHRDCSKGSRQVNHRRLGKGQEWRENHHRERA